MQDNPMKVGPMRFFDGGIRMLLHERAPNALNPGVQVPDLASEFPGHEFWLRNHLLNVGLKSGLAAETRALFLSLIRRASHALAHYNSGREKTLRYASWDRSGAIPASDYFGAIEDWENCLLQFQILIDVMNKSNRGGPAWRAYSRGDRSATERMCEMSNRVKHSTRGDVSVKDLTPIWLEKEGLAALDGFEISYAELADELRGALEMARDLVDPAALIERLRKKDAEAAADGASSDDEA